MVLSAPIFYTSVVYYITWVVLIFGLLVQAVALIHCITQRGDGFQAIGALPKGVWIAILAVCLLFTVIGRNPLSIIPLVGIGFALVYLLDVRQGLKDLSDGKGFW